MATPVGIMQGRLVPPVGDRIQGFPEERWRDEFALAARAGLDAIEWIYDLDDAETNPLATVAGVAEMGRLSRESGVAVRSVCADYFMARPLVRAAPGARAGLEARLDWLLGRCAAAGITRVVLPFVDASKIATPADRDDVVTVLGGALASIERNGVEIHLETSLPPDDFRSLLDRLPHPMIRVNYDSGNSASLGFDPREEWSAYGDRVGSVHIKDRLRGGGTVPLGSGGADFPALFASTRRAGYRGPWVLQVARGEPGGEVEWAKANRALFLEMLREVE